MGPGGSPWAVHQAQWPTLKPSGFWVERSLERGALSQRQRMTPEGHRGPLRRLSQRSHPQKPQKSETPPSG